MRTKNRQDFIVIQSRGLASPRAAPKINAELVPLVDSPAPYGFTSFSNGEALEKSPGTLQLLAFDG